MAKDISFLPSIRKAPDLERAFALSFNKIRDFIKGFFNEVNFFKLNTIVV